MNPVNDSRVGGGEVGDGVVRIQRSSLCSNHAVTTEIRPLYSNKSTSSASTSGW